MRGLRLSMDENRIRFIQDLLKPDRTNGGRPYSTSKDEGAGCHPICLGRRNADRYRGQPQTRMKWFWRRQAKKLSKKSPWPTKLFLPDVKSSYRDRPASRPDRMALYRDDITQIQEPLKKGRTFEWQSTHLRTVSEPAAKAMSGLSAFQRFK